MAFFVNAAILIVSAAVFGRREMDVTSIEEAHKLLPTFLGEAAPILFGVALLCAGQSSTLTGTLAGQIVMEGYLSLRMAPWLRRLITRLIALVPAVVVIAIAGEECDPAALDPEPGRLELAALVRGDSADSLHVKPAEHGSICHASVGAGPGVVRGGDHCRPQWEAGSRSGRRMGRGIVIERRSYRSDPALLAWRCGTLRDRGAASLLLVWVMVKPLVRPSPAWLPKPSVKLNWTQLLRPRPLSRIGVALEHNTNDAEILNRALGLAQSQSEPPSSCSCTLSTRR